MNFLKTCGLGLGLLFAVWVFSHTPAAAAFSAGREYEPFILTGSTLPQWVGSDATWVTFYVYNGTGFVPVPFQYDKRRKIHTNYNVNPLDAWYQQENCELGYFAELHSGPSGGSPADFTSNLLQSTDEFAFLLRDVFGGVQAPITQWILTAGVTNDRYEITLKDPLSNTFAYLYAFRWAIAPPSSEFDTTDYVQWTQDQGIPTCPPVPAACSTVATIPSSRLGGVATLDVHFGGNWITDALKIREHGSDPTPHDDVLDRFKYTAPPNETEDLWSSDQSNASPEFLGYTDGRIRAIRGVEGAKSGRHTTKYEFVYPTMFITRVNLRVHDIDYITSNLNHEKSLADDAKNPVNHPAYLWSQTSYSQPNPLDIVDGACLPPTSGTCYAATEFLYGDWMEMSSPIKGSYVHLFREPRPMPIKAQGGAKSPLYLDLGGSGSNAGAYGQFGRRWDNLACTDDGLDGGPSGCANPEDPTLYFARTEALVIPNQAQSVPTNPNSIVAPQFEANLDTPVQVTTNWEDRNGSPPIGPSPCAPTIGGQDPHSGAVNLSVGTQGPCPGNVGVRMYRAEGQGPFLFLKDVGMAASWTDYTSYPGVSYRYRALGYNVNNLESAYSNEVTIAPTDTTPPPAPSGVSGTGNGTTATLTMLVPCTRDLAGVNVYISNVPGGQYTKVNGSLVRATSRPVQYVQGGLQPNTTYYFVVTSVDFSGNESGFSPEAVVNTGS